MQITVAAFFRSVLLGASLSVLCVSSAAYAADTDCDGIDDTVDNCPAKFNPDQGDLDGDHIGDRCDSNKDNDALDNDLDNCPKVANDDQADTDGDSVGDACDQCAAAPDDVVNGHGCTIAQLCPCSGPDDDRAWKDHGGYVKCVKKAARKFAIHELITSEERQQTVIDAKASTCGVPVPVEGDNDGDGVADASDNCPSDSNPGQRNTDGDAFGDACDTDRDNDGVPNASDNCPIVQNADSQGSENDADSDGAGNACDACPGTASGDAVDNDGCSIAQACPCDFDEDGNPWAGHMKYRRCVADEVFRFRLLKIITGDEADQIKEDAAASTCGNRPPVCE